jgi:hypothetical protein
MATPMLTSMKSPLSLRACLKRRFVPLEVPKSVVRLEIDDQSTDIANLVNGSHIDTNMEKFLYGRIKRQKHKLKWTSKILKTYVHGTNTGNFVPLEKYVQSMTLKKKTSTTSTSTRFVCSGEVHSSQRLLRFGTD